MASYIFFIVSLIAGLTCVGGFLWSSMEKKPRGIWLLGAGIAVIVGIAGLLFQGKNF